MKRNKQVTPDAQADRLEGPWPRQLEGVPVVPAAWLGAASGNEEGQAFMRAYARLKAGEPDPKGAVPCVGCGFPCENDQTLFAVPVEFARFSRHWPYPEGWVQTPTAHVACSHTMYRGRYDDLRRMVEEGVPHQEMIERIQAWPFDVEEAEEIEAQSRAAAKENYKKRSKR